MIVTIIGIIQNGKSGNHSDIKSDDSCMDLEKQNFEMF